MMSLLLTAMAIVKEKEIGTMEQLISTPVKAPELVMGKFIPYFAIGFFDLTVGVQLSVDPSSFHYDATRS